MCCLLMFAKQSGEKVVHNVASVANHLHAPVEFEGDLFFFGQMPGYGGVGTHFFSEVEEREGSTHANIETFGKAVHGNFDISVGVVNGFGCKACEFGAEDEGCGLRDVKVGDEGVVFVWQSGDNAVSFFA